MTRAIITTTINPPQNVDAWEVQLRSGDMIIVAGDMKTPHEEWVEWEKGESTILRRYLPPAKQEEWEVSKIIGWNSIQRRNIALLYAMCQKPDTITTIDDDNWPVDDQWFDRFPRPTYTWYSDSGWWNPGRMCRPMIRHRGMPFGVSGAGLTGTKDRLVGWHRIGVWASLWLDDPDIDAMERIVNDPQIDEITEDRVLDFGTWAPFNSQSTTYRAELAPIMPVLPFVGRMDDIWASYIARAIMDTIDVHVCYGEPLVRQVRNPHNLLADLQGEMIGYEHTAQFCERLRLWGSKLNDWKEQPDNIGRYFYMARRIFDDPTLDWFPRRTSRFMLAWCRDVRTALKS